MHAVTKFSNVQPRYRKLILFNAAGLWDPKKLLSQSNDAFLRRYPGI